MKVYVGNLPWSITDLDLENLFTPFGSVESAAVVTDRDALLKAVREREAKLSTGIGLGIAVPHARIESVTEFVVVVGRHPKGIEFGSIDGKPVHIVVLIAGPRQAKTPYLELLAQLSKRLKLEDVRERLTGDADAEEVLSLLVD